MFFLGSESRLAHGSEVLASQGLWLADPSSWPCDDPLLSNGVFLQDLAGNAFNAQTCLMCTVIMLTTLAWLEHEKGNNIMMSNSTTPCAIAGISVQVRFS